MISRPFVFAAGILPLLVPGFALAQSASTSISTTSATTTVATPVADAAAAPDAAPAPVEVSDWTGWNTGGKEAGFGFAMMPHIGMGHRFNEASAPGAGPNSLLLGADVLLRFNKYFGLGIGYEHAGYDNELSDSGREYTDIRRQLNTMWIQGRVYPLRFDPVALYINVAAGPSWEGIQTRYTSVDVLGRTVATACSGDADARFSLRGGVGGEVALTGGFFLFGEVGPTWHKLGNAGLGDCGLAQGNAINLDFRVGLALGAETTRNRVPPADTDKDGIADAIDACPNEPGVASDDRETNGCPDKDGDGVFDKQDACVDVAGLKTADASTNGCPDSDGDGIFDQSDACPDAAGPTSEDPKRNGCPVNDKDGDGVWDEDDACPELAGVKTDDPKTNGCPGDRDGDAIRDDKDACPDEAGKADADPKKNGCPLVVVRAEEIVINEQVQFKTGSAAIDSASDALLDGIADVFKKHAEILEVEVQGHTDNRGARVLNTKLSKDRAASVVKALVKRGVEASRLVSQGYGPDKPIASNDTDEGRQQNRRVQFMILKKAPKADAQPAATGK